MRRAAGILVVGLAGAVLTVSGGATAAPVGVSYGGSGGAVVGWGYNADGQAGSPAAVADGVTALAAGTFHSLALKADGTVVGWGRNDRGQATVPAAATGVRAISAAGNASLALRADGSVIAWGDNGTGQSTVPVEAQSGVSAVSSGGSYSLALREGGVVAWGSPGQRQTTIPASARDGVTAVAAGSSFAVALKDGGVIAWGNDQYDQTVVPAGARTGVTAVAAGNDHTLALKADGSVVAWGRDTFGQSAVPAAAGTDVVAVAAGGWSSLALKSDGSVVAWGWDSFGQAQVPVAASSGVVALAAGLNHALALTVAFTDAAPPSGAYGAPYSYRFVAGPGAQPATYSVADGSLPPGLTLDAGTGLVSGTPTAAGTSTFTVRQTRAGTGRDAPPSTVVVAPRLLTVSAQNQAVGYGDPEPEFSHTETGLLDGDAFTTAPTCGVAGPHVRAGAYEITCTGASAGADYTVTTQPGTLTVDRAQVVVTADNAATTYGQDVPALGSSVTGLRNGDELVTAPVCAVDGPHRAAGSYRISCRDAVATPDYVLTAKPGTLTVAPAALTVTAGSHSVLAGEPDPDFGAEVTGLVGDDALRTPPTCGVTGEHASAGSYAVECAGADAGPDYTIGYRPGTLTVTSRPWVVTADAATARYGEPDPQFGFTVSGLEEGEVLASPPTCAVAAPAGARRSVGTYPIVCQGGDGGPGHPLTYVAGTLAVTPAPLTVTAPNATHVYGTAAPALTPEVGGLLDGDTLTTSPTCSVPADSQHAGRYPVTCAGTAAGPDYEVTELPGTLTVTPAAAVVTAANAVKVYGTPDPAFEYDVTGLVGDDALRARPTCGVAVAHPGAGSYSVTCTGAQVSDDYTLTARPGTLTVTKAPTALTAPPLLYSWLQPTARLTRPDTGAAVTGRTVVFTAEGRRLCSAVTDSRGRARCSGTFVVVPELVATFPGDPDHQPSHDTTGLF